MPTSDNELALRTHLPTYSATSSSPGGPGWLMKSTTWGYRKHLGERSLANAVSTAFHYPSIQCNGTPTERPARYQRAELEDHPTRAPFSKRELKIFSVVRKLIRSEPGMAHNQPTNASCKPKLLSSSTNLSHPASHCQLFMGKSILCFMKNSR